MPMKKVCPRCGAALNCLHNAILSCHCVSVELDSLQKSYLEQNYSDCLCHTCLEQIRDNFYACAVNPRFKIRKNDKKSINCQ